MMVSFNIKPTHTDPRHHGPPKIHTTKDGLTTTCGRRIRGDWFSTKDKVTCRNCLWEKIHIRKEAPAHG